MLYAVTTMSRSSVLALRPPRIFRGVDPGSHDVRVVLRPLPGTLNRIARSFDRVLEIVDLALVELHRIQERVGHRVILLKTIPHDREDLRRLRQVAQSILRILEVPEIEPLVHPVWPPGDKSELLPVIVASLDLGEHARRARLYESLLEVVRRYDVLGDPLHDHGARL